MVGLKCEIILLIFNSFVCVKILWSAHMHLRMKICLRFRHFLLAFSSKYCSATKFYLLRISSQIICSKNSCGLLKWKNFTMRSYLMYQNRCFQKSLSDGLRQNFKLKNQKFPGKFPYIFCGIITKDSIILIIAKLKAKEASICRIVLWMWIN